MSASQRKYVYIALLILNGAMISLVSSGVLPSSASDVVKMVSLLVAMGMKEFGAQDPVPPAAS